MYDSKKALSEKKYELFKISLFSPIYQLWKNIFQNFAVFANPTILSKFEIKSLKN